MAAGSTYAFACGDMLTITRLRRAATLLAALALLTAMSDSSGPQPDPWRSLFDGKTTKGWRAYGKQTMPEGWQVVDGALTRVADAADIVTEEQFDNYELELEWKVAPGGNSGIFYRAIEGPEYIHHSAPEMQVLDDAAHNDGKNVLTSAGSAYGLYAPSVKAAKPAGQWNAVRLVVNGAHVEHWLNGIKIVEYELWSSGWDAKVKGSKFAQWPEFGRARKGHIGLQDHGDRVAYRNIRIRRLVVRE